MGQDFHDDLLKFRHRMGSIFLSYRRDDAEGQAGRLYDDLVAEFGSNAVFMDVAAIEPGRDFRRAIDQSLSSCGVFLALIGRNWLAATDAAGRRRLDDPADFVRIETAAALRRDIPEMCIRDRSEESRRVEIGYYPRSRVNASTQATRRVGILIVTMFHIRSSRMASYS